MASPRPPVGRILRLAAAVAVAVCAYFPTPRLRYPAMYVLHLQSIHGLTAAQQQGIAFPASYVCSALSINPWSHCCPTTDDRFSCQGSKLDLQCCNSYEYCVSCCLNPSKIKKEDVLKLKVAKPVTAGTYTNVFDFCMGRCRHSSASPTRLQVCCPVCGGMVEDDGVFLLQMVEDDCVFLVQNSKAAVPV